jgi:hypothetical protein
MLMWWRIEDWGEGNEDSQAIPIRCSKCIVCQHTNVLVISVISYQNRRLFAMTFFLCIEYTVKFFSRWELFYWTLWKSCRLCSRITGTRKYRAIRKRFADWLMSITQAETYCRARDWCPGYHNYLLVAAFSSCSHHSFSNRINRLQSNTTKT